MDKEMIERCADAFLRAFFSRDMDDRVITITSQDHHDLIIPIIKAMREPTENMIEAGYHRPHLDAKANTALTWNNMIDAIIGAE